ncbi:MAG: PAS domain-containing protein [Oscillospiraceae bacterium]|nr:PAS domain-containing protein [Oscillospiraceae bacterium]
MELSLLFKSVLDSDYAPIVLCSLDHEIVYMNPSAVERYKKRGGSALIGSSLLDCHNEESNEKIRQVVEWFRASAENNRVYTFYNEKENKDVYMVALRDDDGVLIGYYEKHEYRDRDNGEFYQMK